MARARPQLLTLLVLIALATCGLLLYRPLLRWFYPVPYAEIIERNARRYDVDPFIILSIMRVESAFKERAVSRRDARGLMQILPDTGREIAAQLGISDFRSEQLFDPATNIEIGTHYFASLLRMFNGHLPPALAAYNGGWNNVRRWLEAKEWDGQAATVEDIPFPETRQYVRRVLAVYRGYRRVYGDDWSAVSLDKRPAFPACRGFYSEL